MIKIISLFSMFIYLIIIPLLPNSIPIHYDINFNPDKYASKYYYLFITLIPPLTLYLYTFFSKKDHNNTIAIKKITCYILVIFLNSIIISFLLILLNPNFFILINITISLFIIALGFLFPHLKQNKYIGIRTKKTLTNKHVWNKIHSNSKNIFVSVGLVMLIINNLLISMLLIIFSILYLFIKIMKL